MKKWSTLAYTTESHVLHSPGEFQETLLASFSSVYVHASPQLLKKNADSDGAGFWGPGEFGDHPLSMEESKHQTVPLRGQNLS